VRNGEWIAVGVKLAIFFVTNSAGSEVDPLENKKNRTTSSFFRSLRAGLLSGWVSGVAVASVYGIIRFTTGFDPPQFNAFILFMATWVTHIIGSIIYFILSLRIRKPEWVLVTLAFLIATVDSVYVWFEPTPGLALIAIPIHYLVAWTASWFILRWAQRR